MYIPLIVVALLMLPHRSRCTEKKKRGAEKTIPFQKRVENTYDKVVSCLQLGPTLNHQRLSFDADLESHYNDILRVTAQFRGLPAHNGSYYAGMTSIVDGQRD